MIRFEVLGDPRPKGSFRPIRTPGTDRVFLKESAGEGLRTWREQLAAGCVQAAEQLSAPLAGPVAVMILFRLRPPKARKHAFPIARNRNDIDKLERAVLDHLSGVLVEDDAQVAFVAKGKTFSERPGATIAILELGPNGETRVDLGTLALEAVNEFLPGGDRQVVTDR